MFQRIDSVVLFVPNLKQGLKFYCHTLGHDLAWQKKRSAGLSLPDADTEIVLSEELPQGTDLLVDSVDKAYAFLIKKGCRAVREPFDIEVGKCAQVLDPFGNLLSFLDLSEL